MRRSAAPSFRADIKRARFLPHIMKTVPLIGKENKHYSCSENDNASDTRSEINNLSNIPVTVIDTTNEKNGSPEIVRSNKDIMDIIFDADSTVSDIENASENIFKEKHILGTSKESTQSNIKPLKINSPVISSHSNINEDFGNRMSSCIFCVTDVDEATLFNVVWCKRSGKKHKTWEGDGLLIVRSRSAVLKDLNGKILDKGLGYKLKETESLEEGSKFFIGGKECEIQCKISDEECQSGKYCKCNSTTDVNTQSPVKQPEKQVVPVRTHKPC